MQLGHTYRFVAQNTLGQTIAIGGLKITMRRWKFASDGSLSFDTEATVLQNAGTIATTAFAQGTTQDNSTAKWIGADIVLTATAPASSNGDVIVWYQESTDGGVTWPDDGFGVALGSINFTTSGTKRDNLVL